MDDIDSYREAKPFEEVQMEVAKLLRGKILIGHAVHNDTKVRSSTCSPKSSYMASRRCFFPILDQIPEIRSTSLGSTRL
jgi:hypothetical protein